MVIYELFTHNKLYLKAEEMKSTNDELTKVPVCHTLKQIREELEEKRKKIAQMNVDDIIGIMDAVGRLWRNVDFELRRIIKKLALQSGQYSEEVIELSLQYMCNMYSRQYLEKITDYDLHGTRHILDDFIKTYEDSPIMVKAVPRGIAGHWLSGNTLIIGQISLLRAMVTKNASIIKVSSKEKVFISLFLESFKYVTYKSSSGTLIPGSVLTEAAAVVFFDSSDKECNEELSRVVRTRIARGGKVAIDAIMNTKKTYGTEDVIYGPKYSLMAVGRECLDKKNIGNLVKNAAMDFSIWDQYACTSPHLVVVEKGGETSVEEFAEMLAQEMENVEQVLPNHSVTVDNAPAIVAVRIENAFTGKTLAGSTTAWTVLLSRGLEELPEPLFSRQVRVIEVDSVEELYPLLDRYNQSMGLAMTGERRKKFIQKCTYAGIERCVPVGWMHTMLPGSPWDGFFNCDRLVRWVSCFTEEPMYTQKNTILDF